MVEAVEWALKESRAKGKIGGNKVFMGMGPALFTPCILKSVLNCKTLKDLT
jgi:hypothetical protein